MPGLPWVRLDANIYSHDKILQLKARRDGWRAIAVTRDDLVVMADHYAARLREVTGDE